MANFLMVSNTIRVMSILYFTVKFMAALQCSFTCFYACDHVKSHNPLSRNMSAYDSQGVPFSDAKYKTQSFEPEVVIHEV